MPNDQPETLSAIIAEMRAELDCIDDTKVIPVVYIKNRLPRIEAAYKREHAEWHAETDAAKDDRNRVACRMRYEFAAKCRACKATTGNAAAMREALEKCAELGDQIDNWLGSDEATVWNCRNERSAAHNIMLTARAALAAPARNCDVGTADDLHASFVRHCDACNPPGGCCHRKDTRGMLDTNCASILKCFARFAIANKEGDKK